MAPLPGHQFRRLLRAMDADGFCRFVADCWRARGWTVEREPGGPLVVEHPTLGDRRTLAVRAVPWWRPGTPSLAPTDADLTVVNRSVAGSHPAVVDADDLHDVVRYALGPDAGADLVADHVDRSGTVAGRAIRLAPRRVDTRPAVVAVALAVLLLAAVGLAVIPGGQPASGLDETGDGLTPVEPVGDPGTPSQFAATRWPGGGGSYPPGVEEDGVADPAALAATHSRRAGEVPYELTLTVTEYADGRPVGAYEERIAIRNTWTFTSSIETSGDVRADHPVISGVGMYSAGNRVFVHVDADRSVDRQAALRTSPGDVRGLENRVERYLAAVLALEESAVVETTQIGDTALHRVNGTGAGPDGANRSVSALVSAGGTIHEVRTERDLPGSNRSVVVTLEYGFGDVAVAPPRWLGNDSAIVGDSFPLSKR